MDRLLHNTWGRWALFVLGWTVLSLLFVPEAYLFFLYRGDAIPVSRIVALTLANAGIVVLFVPGIVWLTRRYPLERGTWRKALLVHFPACLLFSLSHSWLYAMLCYASPKLFHMLFLRFHPNLLTYWAVVAFASAGEYFRRYSEREKQLAQAELHLFNSLHTISAMMHEDTKAADRMISRLSELLRIVVDGIGRHEVPLQEEVSLVRAYVEIERLRFHENLHITLDLEPQVLNALVPTMILQPLAENSVHHAFASRRSTGVIRVVACRRDDRLAITVADNGTGFEPGWHEGLGLTNTRQRLAQLYPGNYRFEIANRPEGGAALTFEVPFRLAPGGISGVIAESLDNENPRISRGRREVGTKTNSHAAQGRS